MGKAHQVILGASAAGCAALEAIRSVDPECPVTVISKEPPPLYSRVGLTHYIAQEVPYSGMVMRDDGYLRRMKAKGILGVGVAEVDARNRRVKLETGRSVPYDNLLVGTGSHAVVPPIPGADLKGIYPCITNRDARGIVRAIPRTKQCVVVGAGLIGIQAVDALARRGLRVVAVERLPHLMPLMVDNAGARIITADCEKKGVTVRAGLSASEIQGRQGRVTAVRLENGERFPCQMVIMAAGVAPNIDFLRGTPVQVNRGIVVDACQQTGVEGIYAAGDVAETTDMISGERVVNAIWPEALNQGRVAGLNMAGVRTEYEGSLAMNTTAVLHIPLASLGAWNVEGDGYEVHRQLSEERQLYRKVIFRDDQLVGAVLMGRIDEAGVLHNMIRTRTMWQVKKDDVIRGPLTWGRVTFANAMAGHA